MRWKNGEYENHFSKPRVFSFLWISIAVSYFENKHLPFKTNIDVTIILEKFERFLDKYHE